MNYPQFPWLAQRTNNLSVLNVGIATTTGLLRNANERPRKRVDTGLGGNRNVRAGGHLHLDFCLYFHYTEQPVLTDISWFGTLAGQCSSLTKGRGSGNNRWGTSSRTRHKPGQSLQRAGEELGRGQEAPAQRLKVARPAPRTTQTPTPQAGPRGRCASSHWLELSGPRLLFEAGV